MDIFKFHNPSSPTKFEGGEIVEDLKTKMWVERYIKEGEFRLTALATSGMRQRLPIGSFISHLNTPEVMIVENHEISEEPASEPVITITGRSFETELDQRVVGSNIVYPIAGLPVDHNMASDFLENQIPTLINHYIQTSTLVDDDNALPFVIATSSITVPTPTNVPRQIKPGSLYTRIQELLLIENFGLKVIRPGPFWTVWAPYVPDNTYLTLIVHKGVDRTKTVSFSYDTGEIVSADYLWSNKKLKNAALIIGKWITTEVVPAAIEYGRRWMLIDGTDIDGGYDAILEDDVPLISALMQQRAIDLLRSQVDLALTKAEVSKENTKAIFRRDFDVGDLITVHGDYNESSKMRVSEYVEIEDDTGESGYPTLTIDQEES